MYQRKTSPKDREPDFLQLLLLRSKVQEMLKECHGDNVRSFWFIKDKKAGNEEILLE